MVDQIYKNAELLLILKYGSVKQAYLSSLFWQDEVTVDFSEEEFKILKAFERAEFPIQPKSPPDE